MIEEEKLKIEALPLRQKKNEVFGKSLVHAGAASPAPVQPACKHVVAKQANFANAVVNALKIAAIQRNNYFVTKIFENSLATSRSFFTCSSVISPVLKISS